MVECAGTPERCGETMAKRKTKAPGRKGKPSDEELIAAFKQGDMRAFEELVSRYEAKVYHLALRLTRSEMDAEEILQDAFMKVHDKLHTFRGDSKFSSWLYRVVANLAYMKLRKRKRDPQVSLEDVLPALQQNHASEPIIDWAHRPDEELLADETRRILDEAIGKLPLKHRAVFVLRDVEGLSNKEVAEILNLTVPTVKSRLHWARLFLRKELAEYFSQAKEAHS